MDTAPVRIVRCFHCRGMMKVSTKALSVFCPHCQKRVNLEDMRIVGTHPGRALMTCGDILIEQTARLQVQVFGRNVTIHGRVRGPVLASESIEVGPTGQVMGNLRARKIIVRDGAKIEGKCEIVLPPPPVVQSVATAAQSEPASALEPNQPPPVEPILINRPRPLPLPPRKQTEVAES